MRLRLPVFTTLVFDLRILTLYSLNISRIIDICMLSFSPPLAQGHPCRMPCKYSRDYIGVDAFDVIYLRNL